MLRNVEKKRGRGKGEEKEGNILAGACVIKFQVLMREKNTVESKHCKILAWESGPGLRCIFMLSNGLKKKNMHFSLVGGPL